MAGRSHRAPGGWFAVLSFGARQTLRPRTSGTNARDLDSCANSLCQRQRNFVSTVEYVFGFLLIVGALTPLACVMLGSVLIVAIATSAIKNIKAPPLLGWLSEFLYLPEVLYLVILFWLFLSGPGRFSVDHLILFK